MKDPYRTRWGRRSGAPRWVVVPVPADTTHRYRGRMTDHTFLGNRLRNPARILATAAILAGVVISTSACGVISPKTEPTPEPVPTIVWQDGAPTGELESNEYVQVLRKALPAMAAAHNQRNYTLPEAYETIGYPDLANQASTAKWELNRDAPFLIYPGPRPSTPLTVEKGWMTDDGQEIHVIGCQIDNWTSEEGTVPEKPIRVLGAIYGFTEVEGGLKLTSRISKPGLDCEGVDIKVGVFDPAPTPSTVSDATSVIKPVLPSKRGTATPTP